MKENDTNRAGTGTRVSSFIRDRSIHWDADLKLKGAASPTLIVDQDQAGNAVVTTANGVSIQDTDATTLGNVAAANIVVNSINNNAAYGNVHIEIPRRGAPADDTGVVDGNLGSVTVERGFDEVNLINRSSKPMTVNNIQVFNMSTPNIVVDAPDSSVLSFPVFHDFGDTHVNVQNAIKTAPAPALTLNGIIQNPVGETEVQAGAIIKSGTGKIVTNVANLSSTVGNIGSGTRLPIEIVLSDGRQEDLFVNSAGSVSLDLVARQRQATGTPPATIDVSGIQAVSTNNVLYHTTLMENSLPNTLPLLRVNEIQESDITDVVSFFETPEEILNLDLGALGTGATTLVPSTWDHDLVKGSAITLALDSTQIDGPLMNITGNTDVGSSNTNISTNGNIVLTEVAGAMRIGAITTTRGDVVLNSSNAILASPSDTAADVIGSSVTLNAATTIGSTTAPVDVDSGNRLHASASGDIVLVETSGNINIGRIATTGGNVVLTATTGSFLDADADIAADIVGQGLTLTANNSTTTPSPSIGTSSNPIEIDSTGVVRAIARGDIQLVETSGSLTLAEARSTQGNIRVDVLDQSTSGNDLTLNAAQVIANAGSVQLNAGDNLTASAGTLIQGTLIGMVSDFGDADPGVGTTVQLSGTFVGRPITLATGNDVDNVTLSQATFQGQTNLSLGAGNDSLTLDRLAPLTTTNAGVRDTLAVNLGTGAHSVQMISSPTGNIIVPITATRGTGLNTLTVQDTTSNDAFALNASQLGITRPGTGISELLTFGATFDRVDIQASEGNDALGVDLSGGNLNFANGVAFAGGNGTDQVTVNGSSLADFFEVDATSSTSGTLRTQVNNGTMSAPTTLTSVEQVGINGQSPTSNPGDRLRILDSVSGIPTIPSGSLVTPLPVSYTNIEQVLVGGIPAATNDSFTIQEDTNGSFNLFANDLGLTDTPLTVSVVQPTFGTVVYNNGGTPLQISDDRFQFTPRAHFSGTTSFQYTVVDANGESSTATASITIEPIADAPIVSAQKATGSEGVPIPLKVDAKLVDTDGSETLQVSMRQVPSIAFFVDGKGNEVGVNQGGGVWNLTAVNLSDLYLVVKDNGNFPLVMIATSSDSGKSSAISSVTFDVEVTNVAPNATIMSSPTDATKDTTVTVQMAATDPSTIDKEAGFLYSINWGDGTAIQTVQGAPGVPPSVDHIYTANGTYTITISATDKDGGVGPTTSQVIRIGQSGIVPDPLRPGQSMLVLLGSDANDDIRITRQGNGNQGRLFVYRNNELTETYPIPSSRILVQGYAGDDTIIVDANVSTDTWLFGSLGDDILIGGSGNNVLLGSDGDDQLRSRQGLDILFGGAGRDFLFGGSDDDILHAGTSVYDLSDAALFAIQQEWLRPLDVETRVAHLKGTLAGGLNGSRFLIGSGPNQTAFDDGVRDLIDNHRTKDFVLANTDQAIRDLFNPTELFEELDGSSGSSGSSFGEGESQEESNELALFTPFFLDVDGNGQVSPLDALLILNWLNTHRTLSQETDTDWLLDTDSDQRLSPRDALVVINHLNKMSHASYQPEGETEDLTGPSQQIGSAFDGSFLSDLDVKKRNTR
ncbi:MAG: Ig-like domain-containing protein [Pirellulales bacterium]